MGVPRPRVSATCRSCSASAPDPSSYMRSSKLAISCGECLRLRTIDPHSCVKQRLFSSLVPSRRHLQAQCGQTRARRVRRYRWGRGRSLLDRLQQTFPELEWLSRLRREAQDLARRARWTPPTPGEIIEIAADVSRRWVTDDTGLRAVLVASLTRAAQQLQAPTPAAADLWNTSTQRPKLENDLSDWLKRHLDNDLQGRGIVVGREVQIRPGPGGKMGESGDLVVEAVAGERVEGADVVARDSLKLVRKWRGNHLAGARRGRETRAWSCGRPWSGRCTPVADSSGSGKLQRG
jgi:hypothetical protein